MLASISVQVHDGRWGRYYPVNRSVKPHGTGWIGLLNSPRWPYRVGYGDIRCYVESTDMEVEGDGWRPPETSFWRTASAYMTL